MAAPERERARPILTVGGRGGIWPVREKWNFSPSVSREGRSRRSICLSLLRVSSSQMINSLTALKGTGTGSLNVRPLPTRVFLKVLVRDGALVGEELEIVVGDAEDFFELAEVDAGFGGDADFTDGAGVGGVVEIEDEEQAGEQDGGGEKGEEEVGENRERNGRRR
jgi:hypothetical protein